MSVRQTPLELPHVTFLTHRPLAIFARDLMEYFFGERNSAGTPTSGGER